MFFHFLFVTLTTSALQFQLNNNISGLSFISQAGVGVSTSNGWFKLDGGFKIVNFANNLAASSQTSNSFGFHITHGEDVEFYENTNVGSALLPLLLHGNSYSPLMDVSTNSNFHVFPLQFNNTNIPLEKCSQPDPLSTANPPILNLNVSGFRTLNKLSLSWVWPTVYTRSMPIITMLSNSGDPISSCVVPQLLRQVVDDCTEAQTLIFDWEDAITQKCFYNVSNGDNSDSAQIQYSGIMSLAATERVVVAKGNPYLRNLEYEFKSEFLFSKFAVVGGDVTILAPIDITEVIVGQVHKNSVNPPTTYISIVTEIEYPFKLEVFHPNSWNIIPYGSNNNLTTATLTAVDLSSSGYINVDATESGTYTLQSWQVQIVPGTGACQVDGLYNGTNVFQITCVDLTSVDCDPPLSTGVSMTLSIYSENFCGQVVANIGTVLSLVATDNSFHSPSSALLIGPKEKAYYKIGILNSSPSVSVTKITVDRILVSTPNMTPTKPVALLLGNFTSLGFEIDESSTDLEIHFRFNIDDNTIFDVSPASTDKLSITVRVNVEYLGGISKKRWISDAPAQSTVMEVSATTNVQATYSSSSVIIPSLYLFVVILIACIMI